MLTTETRGSRLLVDVHVRPGQSNTLREDALAGLTRTPKQLPPKHFYDTRGSELFDAICRTPEYYPTRTEQRLLEQVAERVMRSVRPTHLVELGSGMARKTHVLLTSAAGQGLQPRYVPFDVSESALRHSAETLLSSYGWLSVHGVVGDYDHHLHLIPRGDRRLIAFLGGTIGNFEQQDAIRFLQRVAKTMGPGDALLLGTDLVKAKATLDRAYNDAEGVTAAFNLNVLRVMNRELGANFDEARFKHIAFYDEDTRRIEMHLESLAEQRVRLGGLDLEVEFKLGERMRTEISRKFSEAAVAELLGAAGLELANWFTPSDQAFALSLARLPSRN
ncbi:MAG: L-histidine N(alpha)-methyltransferase [Polyangiaceae bacterium]|nr:L-histidine N(alpha)-methyltransferase [Myxococcales bacterium]MCB9588285.1 L-histidine N(alpha)-methyltransferase [Polyangiaceae bacterium]